MSRRGVVLTLLLGATGIAIAVVLGIVAAQLTEPSVGISDEPPSISSELVRPDARPGERSSRSRHKRRRPSTTTTTSVAPTTPSEGDVDDGGIEMETPESDEDD